MKNLFVSIGYPYSGKSYWWEVATKKGLIKHDESIRLSYSDVKFDIVGDLKNYNVEEVNKIYYWQIENYMCHQYKNIYLDHTNEDILMRKKYIDIASKCKYNTYYILFDTSIDICYKRCLISNKSDENRLKTIYNIVTKYPPSIQEGPLDIIIVKE